MLPTCFPSIPHPHSPTHIYLYIRLYVHWSNSSSPVKTQRHTAAERLYRGRTVWSVYVWRYKLLKRAKRAEKEKKRKLSKYIDNYYTKINIFLCTYKPYLEYRIASEESWRKYCYFHMRRRSASLWRRGPTHPTAINESARETDQLQPEPRHHIVLCYCSSAHLKKKKRGKKKECFLPPETPIGACSGKRRQCWRDPQITVVLAVRG